MHRSCQEVEVPAKWRKYSWTECNCKLMSSAEMIKVLYGSRLDTHWRIFWTIKQFTQWLYLLYEHFCCPWSFRYQLIHVFSNSQVVITENCSVSIRNGKIIFIQSILRSFIVSANRDQSYLRGSTWKGNYCSHFYSKTNYYFNVGK